MHDIAAPRRAHGRNGAGALHGLADRIALVLEELLDVLDELRRQMIRDPAQFCAESQGDYML